MKIKTIGLGSLGYSSYFQFRGRIDAWKLLIPGVLLNLSLLPSYEHIYSFNLFS